MRESEIAAAREAVGAAFAGLAPPGDDALLHPDCRDDNDIADFYGPLRREDVTRELLVANYAALSFFSATAFRYYLPAYLALALDEPESPEIVVEATLQALDPSLFGQRLEAFQVSKYARFDDLQKGAVTRFLEAFTRDEDLGGIAVEALRYWYAVAPRDVR